MSRSAYLIGGVATGCLLVAICTGNWRAPFGDGLSSLRDQAPAGLASSSINPSRGRVA